MTLLLWQRQNCTKLQFSWIKLGGVYCYPEYCCLSCFEGCALTSSCQSELPTRVSRSLITLPAREWHGPRWSRSLAGLNPLRAGPCLLSGHSVSAASASGCWAEKMAYGLCEGDVWLLLSLGMIHPSLCWLWPPPVNPLVNQFNPPRRSFGGTEHLTLADNIWWTIPRT